MFCSSISHSTGAWERQSRSCRAAGASPSLGHSHLLLLPVTPHPLWHRIPSAHTATLWAGSGSSPQNPHPRKLCPLFSVPLICSLWDLLPQGKQDPQQAKAPTWERVSYLTHILLFMQQLITQSQPQIWICGLEIRHGPSLLNASFTLTGCP